MAQATPTLTPSPSPSVAPPSIEVAPAPAPSEPPAPAPTEVAPPPPPAPAPAPAEVAPVTAPAPTPSPTGPTFAAAPGKGATITSADNRFSLTLRSRIQLRAALTHFKEQEDQLEINVRTLRLSLGGHVLTPDLRYAIQLAFGGNDFDNGSSSPIFDAYIEYVGVRDLNVRVGQFFVPFDRARTIREFALQFVDRQQVVRELSLDRDVGVMLSSSDLFGLGSRLAYNVFVGSGDGRNRFADTKNPNGPQKPGVLLVGRLTVRPFGAFDDDQEGDLTRGAKPRLALGVAGAYNIASSRPGSTTGTTYTVGTYNYTHAAADLVFKWHGFAVLAEGLYRKANDDSHTGKNAAGASVTEWSRSAHGWFVQASQMLTGKLELAGRFEDLHAQDGTDPNLIKTTSGNGGRQAGGAFNIYLNGHAFKLQTDYIHVFAKPSSQAAHVARLQIDASF